jgi:hypothetical protein
MKHGYDIEWSFSLDVYLTSLDTSASDLLSPCTFASDLLYNRSEANHASQSNQSALHATTMLLKLHTEQVAC